MDRGQSGERTVLDRRPGMQRVLGGTHICFHNVQVYELHLGYFITHDIHMVIILYIPCTFFYS